MSIEKKGLLIAYTSSQLHVQCVMPIQCALYMYDGSHVGGRTPCHKANQLHSHNRIVCTCTCTCHVCVKLSMFSLDKQNYNYIHSSTSTSTSSNSTCTVRYKALRSLVACHKLTSFANFVLDSRVRLLPSPRTSPQVNSAFDPAPLR